MSAPVQPDDVLAGKYRVERILGEGGMGIVVAAMHLQLDERVAIKFLLPEALQMGEAVTRFAREARAAAKIRSEHVARVIDVGTLDTGAPYMVMEYLEGNDLGQVLQKTGPLRVGDAVEYLLQACEAIAEAHSLGIVHRDLKPANLFLARRADGSAKIKVLDFGISKIMEGKSSGNEMSMTRTRTMMGSPLYMSPEQMASARNVDARTDIWSLGVILYELLVGSPPYDAESIPELVMRILDSPPPPLRARRPDAPPEIEAAIVKCLQRNQDSRFLSVAELADTLAPFGPKTAAISAERISRLVGTGSLASPIARTGGQAPGVVTVAQARTGVTETEASFGRTASAPHSSRALLLGVAAGLLVVAGGAAGVVLMRPGASAEVPAVSSEGAPKAPVAAAAPSPAPTVAPPSVQPSPAAPEPPTPAKAVESASPVAPAQPAAVAPGKHAAAAPRAPAKPGAAPAAPAKPTAPAAKPAAGKPAAASDDFGDRK